MTNEPIDLLQIKIERAKNELPAETKKAIDAVNWKESLLKIKDKLDLDFEQIADLELEIELLLCGLISTEKFQKEIAVRLDIPKDKTNSLIENINTFIFDKIRQELIKNLDSSIDKKPSPINNNYIQKIQEETQIKKIDSSISHEEIFKSVGIEVVPKKEEAPKSVSFANQKLTGTFQMQNKTSEYTLSNISKQNETPKTTPPKIDPYREIPE